MSELVALTDLHLGDRDPENGSVLTAPEVRKILAGQLGQLSGGHIGTLVVTGDLFECCVPSRTVKQDFLRETECFGLYESTVDDARSFFDELAASVKINHFVWVPGNHDFTLHQRLCAKGKNHEHTTTFGYSLRKSGEWQSSPELTEIFGVAIPNIVAAYPNYVYESWSGWPLAIFTHGHLYDNQVLCPDEGFLRTIGLALETGHLWDAIPDDIDSGGGSWCKKLVELTSHRVADIWPQNLSLLAESVYDYVLRRQIRVLCEHRSAAHGSMAPVTDPPGSGSGDLDPLRGRLHWYLDNILVDIAPVAPLWWLDSPQRQDAMAFSYFVCGHTHHAGRWAHRSLDGLPFEIHDLGGWTMDAAKNKDNVPHTHVLVWDKFPADPVCLALNVGRP
jgi:UDP-2,3-diacylglucosamine pyrophosphatase LpxH